MTRARQALLVFAVSWAILALLRQDTVYGDGILYLDLARQGRIYAHHHLYLPALVAFTRLLELAGIPDRTAGFLFSTFMVAAGNAFLFLALSARLARSSHALALVLLAATAPVTLFFATTVENHGQHYAWVSLALWRIVAADGRGAGAWLVAGLAAVAVPGSHLTGFMLVPALALLAWTAKGPTPRLARTALFVTPLAVYVLLFHLTTWFRSEVLGITPDLLADPIRFEVQSKIFARGLHPQEWLPYLGEVWLLPAFGVWAMFLAAIPTLARRAPARLAVGLLGIAPYVIVLPMHHVQERGAYYLALAPWAVLILTELARGGVLPRIALGGCLALALGQAVVGVIAIERYPGDAPSDAKAFAQQWAADAMRVDAGAPAGNRLYFCDDLWRVTHLGYDQHAGALHLPGSVQQFHAELPKFLGVIAAELPARLRTGPVYVTAELWDRLPELWPELRAFLQTSYRLDPVAAGSFRGWRVQGR